MEQNSDDGTYMRDESEDVLNAHCNAMQAHTATTEEICQKIEKLQQTVKSLTQTVQNWQMNLAQHEKT